MQSINERFAAVKRLGTAESWWVDVYHRLLVLSWVRFAFAFFVFFGLFNFAFGFLYWVIPGTLQGTDDRFLEAVAFSVQTFSTIGYGVFAPVTRWAHFLVALESMLAILATALLTGITFAKFARPTARVRFSHHALIATFDGKPTLMFRMGNLRGNQIVEATVHAIVLRSDVSREGISLRRQTDLTLVRDRSLFFSLTWTVMHVIDDSSPFFGLDAQGIHERNLEVAVSLTGHDGTFSQTVQANAIYTPEDFVFDHYFEDVLEADGGIVRSVNYHRFNAIRPVDAST